MMILSLFDEGMRVRADTPPMSRPTEAIATKQNCNYYGGVLGSAPGVFLRMTPNRCARSLGRRPGFPCGSHTPNRIEAPFSNAEIATGRGVAA